MTSSYFSHNAGEPYPCFLKLARDMKRALPRATEAGPSRGSRSREPHAPKIPEVIEITDEGDEDTGELITRPQGSSPDPIDSISNDLPHPPERSSPFRESVRDGPSTARMQQKLTQSAKGKARDPNMEVTSTLSNDPIENWPRDISPSRAGYVKDQINKIDQNPSNTATRSKPEIVRRINLLETQRGNIKNGKKEAMMPKFKPVVCAGPSDFSLPSYSQHLIDTCTAECARGQRSSGH